jgi:large subunit ribosomal protein L5
MAENENKEAEAPAEAQAEAKPEKAEKPKKDTGGAEGGEKPAKAEGGEKPAKAKGEGKGGGEGKKGDGKKGDGKKGDKGKKAPTGPAKVYKREAPPRLKRMYEEEVRDKLKGEFGFTNPMQIPRLVKISLNMGLGKATQNPKLLDSAVEELKAISGRSPVVTLAKKDIATFKLRKGHKIGVMVTLRREAMWEFLDRFINIALPRVRDFRGISPKAFDGRGNFSAGIKEQIIFPEIEYDNLDAVKGLNVTIVTTARNDSEGRALLRALGMPFRQVAGAESDSGVAKQSGVPPRGAAAQGAQA